MIEEVARPINRRTRGERTKRRERYLMLNNDKLSPTSQLWQHFNNNNDKAVIVKEQKKVRTGCMIWADCNMPTDLIKSKVDSTEISHVLL